MIDPKKLLADLQRLLKKLEDDLRERCGEYADVDTKVRAQYATAKNAGRTSQAYEVWRDEFITQAGVAWILGCVFVRFLEDNDLIDTPCLSGSKDRLTLARDEHILYFREHPTHSDREYLEHVFRDVAKLPAMRELFNEQHNPVWTLGLTGDGATLLLNFWQQIDPTTGALVHDFADDEWNTRFLGDLYQDLSEAARKKYALLQTPIFVEEFILDRTLSPAIDEFGYQAIRLIDPACGSGHFLLGAFQRLFDLWVKNEPGENPRVLAQQALSSVHGVDLNPYAVAIARFRLLLAALKVSDITRLKDAPDFKINLAVGDSLLHGEHKQEQTRMGWHPMAHVYETEDKDALDRLLKRNHYHAVVGNPPYITVKDSALNKAYRERFGSCHGKYSLAVPFMERFFDLALQGNGNTHTPAGFVGMITSNSFMKREFGKKLIEQYILRWDLTHVIDTSGAYIPGHGTPTVILFGRNRGPMADTIRTVMGIRGEPSTPEDAAQGQVWTAIMNQIDVAGSQSDFVSVADTTRAAFHKHPWSIGGGGAAELKEVLDKVLGKQLRDIAISVGITAFTLEDDIFLLQLETARRLKLPHEYLRTMIIGDQIRDWCIAGYDTAVFPYDEEFKPLQDDTYLPCRYLWIGRTNLANNVMFGGKTKVECGLRWYEYGRLTADKLRTPLSITFPFVASHNHFVLDRGGKIFNRSAPIIKLPPGATEDDHLALLGLLNSSLVCFWMKQVSQQKQLTGGDGVRVEAISKVPYEFASTQLEKLPIPNAFFEGSLRENLLMLSRLAESCATRMNDLSPPAAIKVALECGDGPIEEVWSRFQSESRQLRGQLVFLQEEMDFTSYCLFELADESLLSYGVEEARVEMEAGQRPFEIISGKNQDGFDVPIEIPDHWPSRLRSLWQRRIDAIENSPNLQVIEDAHYKRRWIGRQGLFNHTRDTDEMAEACREWLLDRLEDARYWAELQLTSCARLADQVRQDSEFMQVAEFYRERRDFDLLNLITELVRSEAVPFLPVLRYKESGLRKRARWEATWEKQRAEDAIDARTLLPQGDPRQLAKEQAAQLKLEQIGDIPVPPKYKSTDFQDQVYWRLRGKLDVPKERFICYPRCERDADQTMVIAWAGWDQLQQGRALADYYEKVKSSEGWSDARLTPLLAGALELVPWLVQWHNEIDPALNLRLGDFFKSFVEEEARSMGKTIDEIKAWQP